MLRWIRLFTVQKKWKGAVVKYEVYWGIFVGLLCLCKICVSGFLKFEKQSIVICEHNGVCVKRKKRKGKKRRKKKVNLEIKSWK